MRRKGFTLVEILIVIAIFTTFIIITTGLIGNIMRQKNRHIAQLTVNNEARNAIESVTRDVKVAIGASGQTALSNIDSNNDGTIDNNALAIRQSGQLQKNYKTVVDPVTGKSKLVLDKTDYNVIPNVTVSTYDVIVVVDLTGSMSEYIDTNTRKLDALKIALNSFIDTLRTNEGQYVDQVYRLAIISYNVCSDLKPKSQYGSPNYSGVYNQTDGFKPLSYNFSSAINGFRTSSTTCIGGGMKAAGELMNDQTAGARSGATKISILMTDGWGNTPSGSGTNPNDFRDDRWWTDRTYGAGTHIPNFSMFTIGFGRARDVNEPSLQEIVNLTNDNGFDTFTRADNATALNAEYVRIAGQISATETTGYTQIVTTSSDLTSDVANIKDVNFEVNQGNGWPFVKFYLEVDNNRPTTAPNYAHAKIDTVISSREYR